MLFSAFEKHQYYNIKDLVDITKQPVVRLQGDAKRLVMKPKCTAYFKKKALHWTLFLKFMSVMVLKYVEHMQQWLQIMQKRSYS